MISLEQYKMPNRKSLKWLRDYPETSSELKDIDDVNRCILALLSPKMMLYHRKSYLQMHKCCQGLNTRHLIYCFKLLDEMQNIFVTGEEE